MGGGDELPELAGKLIDDARGIAASIDLELVERIMDKEIGAVLIKGDAAIDALKLDEAVFSMANHVASTCWLYAPS